MPFSRRKNASAYIGFQTAKTTLLSASTFPLTAGLKVT